MKIIPDNKPNNVGRLFLALCNFEELDFARMSACTLAAVPQLESRCLCASCNRRFRMNRVIFEVSAAA